MKRLPAFLIFILLFSFGSIKANKTAILPPPPPEIHVDPDTIFELNCYKSSYEVYGYSPADSVILYWVLPDGSISDTNAIEINYVGDYFLVGVDTVAHDTTIQTVHVTGNFSSPVYYVSMPNNPPLCGDTLHVDMGSAGHYQWKTPYGTISNADLVIYEKGNYLLWVWDAYSGCDDIFAFTVDQDCTFGKVTGLFYYDYDQDQVKDLEEPLMTKQVAQKVTVSPTGETLFAPFGKYYKYMDFGVLHTFDWVVDPAWQLTTNNASVSVPGEPNTLTEIEYGMYPNYQHHGMNIYIPYDPPRCNTEVSFTNLIANTGTYPEHGKIVVTYDTLCSFVATDGIHDASQHTITWTYNEILPLYERFEGVMTFLMPDENYIGTELHFLAQVYIDQNGVDVLKDTYSFIPVVHCAFDPNDKLVMPAGVGEQHLTLFGTELQYRIHFENEGNAEAVNIVVEDKLDNNLDVNSLHVVNSSHSVQPSLRDGVITFAFDSIFLAPGAGGFVEYAIMPKANLPEKTKIENTASIFFDLNPPIVTNTTWNTLVSAIPHVDKQEACVPFTVHYTAEALTNFNWLFPGGSPATSQEQDVWVTYQTKGEFESQLNFNGVSIPVSIVAKDVPDAEYNFSVTDLTITTENHSTDAQSYWWDFGDGTNSTEENPIHEFSNSSGNYNIVLVATNECGSDTISRSLFITGSTDLQGNFSLELFPNPSHGSCTLQIQTPQASPVKCLIWDALGRQVYQAKWPATTQLNAKLDIQRLAKGSYHYAVMVGEQVKFGLLSVE